MTSLHPDHLADLRKSGLGEETIAAMQCESVRPQDIKNLSGVKTAYRLRYFNLDGSRNCVERWKLFPSRTTADGHTQKYFQKAGSDPQLYLPPIVTWKDVAPTPTMPVLIVEGEKKAAAACQAGLTASGVGGVWAWRVKLDTGERLVLPILDQFEWRGRLVELVPDSDAWRPDKLLDVCGGMYALGMELISRGAAVQFVRLPEPGGVKVGLDDWLVRVGADWSVSWPNLERIALADPSLKILASWWQGWRATQAEHEALRQQQVTPPEVQEAGGLYTVTFAIHQVRLLFDSLQESRGSLKAELAVNVGPATPPLELMSSTDINLKSDTARKNLAATLKAVSPALPWRGLLSDACAAVIKHHRVGEPPVLLSAETVTEPFSYQVNPFVPKDKSGILFGDGGLGKSTVLLAVGIACATGSAIAGFSALHGRPLYLDYEDSFDVHARRLQRIFAAHPHLAGAIVPYQFCTQPLHLMLPQLRRRIVADGTTLLLVDSMLAACGGNLLDPEMTNRYFMALRQLRIGNLTVAHQPKNLDGREASIYGNVFQSNLSRTVWEVRKQQEPGERELVLAFHHKKVNDDMLNASFGMTVTYSPDASRLELTTADIADYADLAKGLSLPKRIRLALKGRVATSDDLANELEKDEHQVRNRLNEGRGKWCQKVGDEWALL
jgi:hypothetical protein